MISSFQNVANAMRQCVNIIEDYARLSPSSLGNGRSSLAQVQANMQGFDLAIDPAFTNGTIDEPETPKDKDGKGKKDKVKKVPKPKDPNAPKRPPSAYLIYQNAVRDEIKAANPDLPYSEILKAVSARWKNITPEEKQVHCFLFVRVHQLMGTDLRYYLQERECQVPSQQQGIRGPEEVGSGWYRCKLILLETYDYS
jgi:hypothetical protein